MLHSVKINKQTPAVQWLSVSPGEIRLILIRFKEMEYTEVLNAAIIVMFVTSFRHSLWLQLG